MACGDQYHSSQTLAVGGGEYCSRCAEMMGYDKDDEEAEDVCPSCKTAVSDHSAKRGECADCGWPLVNWGCCRCKKENDPANWPICSDCGQNNEDPDDES